MMLKLQQLQERLIASAERMKEQSIDENIIEEETEINLNIDEGNYQKITRILITGGPCAGKRTAISELSVKLETMGFKVLQVPNSVNIMRIAGANI